MHRVIASTVRVVQSEACLDALSFARSPTIVPTWRMYFIRLLTTSGFPRWSWSLKLLLPAQPIRSTYPRSKVRARGGPTMMARLLPCRSRASEGGGSGSGSGAPIQALCCDAVGTLELAPRDSSGYIPPGKSYLRPAVVRSVDASKGRREAQEREPWGWCPGGE